MKRIIIAAALALCAVATPLTTNAKSKTPARPDAATQARQRGLSTINRTSAEAIVGFLASDALEGREAGYNTSFIAAEYVVSQLREAGLEPLDGSYRHPFSAVQPAGTRRPLNRWEVQADSVAKVQQGPYRQMDMVNVFGVIPGERTDEYVIVGAHRDHWGKDPWKVVYQGREVPGASSSSFEELGWGYARDAWKVYYCGEVIPGASPATFRIPDRR